MAKSDTSHPPCVFSLILLLGIDQFIYFNSNRFLHKAIISSAEKLPLSQEFRELLFVAILTWLLYRTLNN